MSDQGYVLDPQLVRDIARDAARSASRRYGDIDSAIAEGGELDKILASGDRTAYGRLHDAVAAEMKTATVTVSWPDEKTPAGQDVTLDGLIDAAHRRRPGFNDDVRIVALLLDIIDDVYGVDGRRTALWCAAGALRVRFADRIADLERRDAEDDSAAGEDDSADGDDE